MRLLRSLAFRPTPESAVSTRREPEPNSRTSNGCVRSSSRGYLATCPLMAVRDDEDHVFLHKRLDMLNRSLLRPFQQSNLDVTGHQQREHLIRVSASCCCSD